jgi:hypothetical protein
VKEKGGRREEGEGKREEGAVRGNWRRVRREKGIRSTAREKVEEVTHPI